MVFQLPSEFCAPDDGVAELELGAKPAVFEKPQNLGQHIKPLHIRGLLEGKPLNRMMVDGGAGVNVMPLKVFEKMGFQEELLKTNTSLSGFTGALTEARGVFSVELTVGSKTMPTAFFVVDVQSRYNSLLGRDWIHANECVPSTLHQCVIQWIGDEVEVVWADDSVCVAMNETCVDEQRGETQCLSGKDLSSYDFISVSKDGFVPVSVKPTDISRLGNMRS